MRFKSICIYVLLFTFFAFTFNLGAGGGSAPNMIFSSWQAGQGVRGGPSNARNPLQVWDTFITNTETTCQLTVEVGYASDQPANAYQLHGYAFEVDAKILLPGLSEEEMKSHTFTFPQQPKQQVTAGTTSFSYSGTGTLSPHWKPSGDKTARRKHCSNWAHKDAYNPQKTPQKGRTLKIDVTFIGYYGTDPNNEKKLEILLPLEQDERDQMRQEYLDQRSTQKSNKPDDSAISIPARTEFSSGNEYNDAHAHSLKIDKNLATKRKHWAQACDKYVGEVLKKEHRITNLHVTGAYRNAHHHLYHVVPSINSDTAFRSHHQYGRALDVRTVDMNGNKKGPKGLENTSATKWVDSKYMADAAKDYAGAGYRKWKYSDGHVHAQWETGDSTSSERAVSQAPEEEEGSEPSPPMGQVNPPPSTITYACSVHSGAESAASSHAWGTAPCSDSTHANYLCLIDQDHSRLIYGYSGTFYECQPHTTGSCGHTYLLSDSYSHRSETCPTNANGDSCTSGTYYACQTHTHEYPPTTVSCARQECDVQLSTRFDHRIDCGNCGGHYWTCITGASYDHTTTFTCRRSGCGQTFTRCNGGPCIRDSGTHVYHWAQ